MRQLTKFLELKCGMNIVQANLNICQGMPQPLPPHSHNIFYKNIKIMNSLKKLLSFTAILGIYFSFYYSVSADETLPNPLGSTDITTQQLIGSVIGAILGIVGSIALVMFIIGGFQWMTAGGNMEKVKKGRDTLVWATLGLVVVFAAYAILRFIFEALT